MAATTPAATATPPLYMTDDLAQGIYVIAQRMAHALQRQVAETSGGPCAAVHGVPQLPGALRLVNEVGSGSYGSVVEALVQLDEVRLAVTHDPLAAAATGAASTLLPPQDRAVAVKLQNVLYDEEDFDRAEYEALIMRWLNRFTETPQPLATRLTLAQRLAFPEFYLASWCRRDQHVLLPPPLQPPPSAATAVGGETTTTLVYTQQERLPLVPTQPVPPRGTRVRHMIMMEMMAGVRAWDFMRHYTAPLVGGRAAWPRRQRRPALWAWLLRAVAVAADLLDRLGVYHNDLTLTNVMVSNTALTLRHDLAGAALRAAPLHVDDAHASLRSSFGLTPLASADPNLVDLIAPVQYTDADARFGGDTNAAVSMVPFVRVYDFGLAETPNFELYVEEAAPQPAAAAAAAADVVGDATRVPTSALRGADEMRRPCANMRMFAQSLFVEAVLPTKQGQLFSLLLDQEALRHFTGTQTYIYRQAEHPYLWHYARDRSTRDEVRRVYHYPDRALLKAQRSAEARRRLVSAWERSLAPAVRQLLREERRVYDETEAQYRLHTADPLRRRRILPLSPAGEQALSSVDAWNAWVDAAFANENVAATERTLRWRLRMPLRIVIVSGERRNFTYDGTALRLVFENHVQAGTFVVRELWAHWKMPLGDEDGNTLVDYLEYNGMRAPAMMAVHLLRELASGNAEPAISQWLAEHTALELYGSPEVARRVLYENTATLAAPSSVGLSTPSSSSSSSLPPVTLSSTTTDAEFVSDSSSNSGGGDSVFAQQQYEMLPTAATMIDDADDGMATMSIEPDNGGGGGRRRVSFETIELL